MEKVREVFARHPLVSRAALAALIVAGLCGSFRVVLGVCTLESDMGHTATLWYGFHHYGWRFCKAFYFPPDNWLFSLVPIHFLIFQTLGTDPNWVLLSGWLIFIGNIALSGGVLQAMGARKAARIVPLALLFTGSYAYRYGLIAYAMSHNTTNLYGLLILLCLVLWIKSRRFSLLGIMLGLAVTGGFSDQWLLATSIFPAALAALGAFAVLKGDANRKSYLLLFLAMAFAILIIKTQIFGIFSFLPSFDFQVAGWSQISENFIWYIRCLGGVLNLVPGNESSALVPAAFSVAVCFLLICGGVVSLASSWRQPMNFFFTLFAALAVGGIGSAFVLSNLPMQDFGSRYLINCIFIIPISIAFAVESRAEKKSNLLPFAAMLVALLFSVAGIASNYSVWRKQAHFPKSVEEIRNFAKFLDERGLHDGYGPYWGSHSNALNWVTDGHIRIRPVVFSKTSGYMIAYRYESSDLWYQSEPASVSPKDYFVVVKNDGVECKDIPLCIAGLKKQFGEPERILPYKEAFVLVWKKPLVGRYQPVTKGTRVVFDGSTEQFGAAGWSIPEPWGKWTCGNLATVLLEPSPKAGTDLDLILEGHAYVSEKHPAQRVEVFVNNHFLEMVTFHSFSDTFKTIRIPSGIAAENQGRLLVEFRLKDPKSPAQLGLGHDCRKLGMGLVSLQLKDSEPENPCLRDYRMERICFGSEGSGSKFTVSGWSRPEGFGVWSDDYAATLLLQLVDKPKGALEMSIEGRAFVTDSHPRQSVEILVNQHILGVAEYRSPENAIKTIRIPAAVAAENQGRMRVEFRMKNPVSPAQLGLGPDYRQLGLGLVALQLKPVE